MRRRCTCRNRRSTGVLKPSGARAATLTLSLCAPVMSDFISEHFEGLDLMDQIELVAADDSMSNDLQFERLSHLVTAYENASDDTKHLKLQELLKTTLENPKLAWFSHGGLVGKDHFVYYVIDQLFKCNGLGARPIYWFLTEIVQAAPTQVVDKYWIVCSSAHPNVCKFHRAVNLH